MFTPNLHSVLSKLIALTNERDLNMLEQSLAQALLDLVAPVQLQRGLILYHAIDLHKQSFSISLLGRNAPPEEMLPALKQVLVNCFRSGRHFAYQSDAASLVTLYPLNDAQNRTTAIIAIELPNGHGGLHDAIMLILQIYQNFTGLINDNERDTLTGLLNRKTFESRVSKVLLQGLGRDKRKTDPRKFKHYLAIFDIDHFKAINDEFGHLIGDEVLLLFSQIMTQSFRDKDLLFRFGGEEFVGVFECVSADIMQTILERFREQVFCFKFPQAGNITVSSGFTEISANDVSAHLIDRADMALYYAKNNGRNRICYYEQLIDAGALQENRKEGDIELF